mmetsp:Transcript_102436/g.294881  ORF Transcript_102436/g.294881 Transcript_102436/m.294881 type:complete len:227 (+) Transcript_102436:119-799(+)
MAFWTRAFRALLLSAPPAAAATVVARAASGGPWGQARAGWDVAGDVRFAVALFVIAWHVLVVAGADCRPRRGAIYATGELAVGRIAAGVLWMCSIFGATSASGAITQPLAPQNIAAVGLGRCRPTTHFAEAATRATAATAATGATQGVAACPAASTAGPTTRAERPPATVARGAAAERAARAALGVIAREVAAVATAAPGPDAASEFSATRDAASATAGAAATTPF